MKIIVGLGNVGKDYEFTRHNVGFIVLDKLVSVLEKDNSLQVDWKKDSSLSAYVAKIPVNGEVIFLVKPLTLMNLSGKAVSAILNFFKEPLENLLVVFDDVDLPLGEVRFKEGGSAGTHNGIKSLISEIGAQNFARIKVGIESRGKFAPNAQDLSSFVLSRFLAEEMDILNDSILIAVQKIMDFIEKAKKT